MDALTTAYQISSLKRCKIMVFPYQNMKTGKVSICFLHLLPKQTMGVIDTSTVKNTLLIHCYI